MDKGRTQYYKRGEHNYNKGRAQGSPLRFVLLNDVDETICSALLVVNCLYGMVGALGCVRDRSGYETLNKIIIKN